MSVKIFEGCVENGQVKLESQMDVPDHTKVYVIVPDVEAVRAAHLHSPHLVHSEQALNFVLEVVEISLGVSLR
ncbi:MAG: hypothetical protein QOE33_1686 [Acidobacteriota bacterium]|nr:hypothetical protein [Acidobacteriota bacterium]